MLSFTVSKNGHARRARGAFPAMLALAMLLAACGGSPVADPEESDAEEPDATEGGETDSEDTGDSEDTASDSGFDATALDRIAEINEELEGLDFDARRARLIELAQEEGGELSFYGSTNERDSVPLIDLFEDITDIDVLQYRAGTASVGQRILQEADANFAGADAVIVGSFETTMLDSEGLFAPLETPVREDIIEAVQSDNSVGVYITATVPVWNTDILGDDFEPGTWEDVLKYDGGPKAYAAIDAPWLATMVTSYFMDELGMTEEEALDIFREGAQDAAIVRGSTVRINMIAAGQYDLAVSVNQHGVEPLLGEAPIAWEPVPEPVVINPVSVSIMANAQNPAAAMLWADFVLTDGQQVLADGGRTPTNQTIEGGFPFDRYRTISENTPLVFENAEKWETLWEEITSGGTVVE